MKSETLEHVLAAAIARRVADGHGTVGEEPVRLGADASSQVARGVSAAHGAVTISLAPHCRDRHHPVRAVPDLPPRLS
jgi:hypothetical protein